MHNPKLCKCYVHPKETYLINHPLNQPKMPYYLPGYPVMPTP